ncbi:GntR family transcriptional regulator [Lysinibacillus sp. 2017]|uniref:FadR/GntR family transcriptional regulator n=1 Tax=unclassified Lysinibacillus TaxID=2636778 RepID=UPI000D52A675|nr:MULTISPECIES: GntR family transcriptional regulator [unclassified Lysinibacillus]AWE08323.1 GntR family transcriptional regulator [Lysinibacillus sp. 2017]TGN35828.1 FadR family transcriptional regulator [Lysinibacillus sp. S2017]
MEEKATKKVFLQIVNQLRELITEQNIQEGEKLPSERVLSEQLQVGRSSVREALRSLELLGLIETKHGGGTYLASMKHHQFVEIVGSFILQDAKSIADVQATRKMYEQEAIRQISRNKTLRVLPIWESFFVKVELEQSLKREDILRECIIVSGNRLAFKIWLQLLAFSTAELQREIQSTEKIHVEMMLTSIQMGYEYEAIEAYDKWMEIISE